MSIALAGLKLAGPELASDVVDLISASANDARAAPAAMIVVAHPGDETIGAGARLERLRHANFVYLTDGAPRRMPDAHSRSFRTQSELAGARRAEAHSALASLGVGPRQLHWLGAVEQEATCQLARLVRRLARLIAHAKPAAVLTHPYEGGHPDHDAAAFAVHSACELVQRTGGAAPAVLEMACVHQGPNGVTDGAFLPDAEREATARRLGTAEQAAKRRLISHFKTQAAVLAMIPLVYEHFRLAPDYDFAEPPTPGTLFYETQDWSFNGSRWRTLVRAASLELGLRGKMWR